MEVEENYRKMMKAREEKARERKEQFEKEKQKIVEETVRKEVNPQHDLFIHQCKLA